MPPSIRLVPHIQLSKGKSAAGRTKQTHVLAVAAITATTRTNPTHVPKEFQETMFDDLSLGPIRLVADHVLFQNRGTTTEGKFDFSTSKPEKEDDGLVKEIEIVMQRLKTVVEKIREMEIEKLKSKTKGQTMSSEESILLENMSREIVSHFLEKPIEYLMSNCGILEDKLKDVNLLVGALEESCSTCLVHKKIHVHT